MKRGQASTEYLMVAAIALFVLIPTVYLFYSESMKSAQRAMEAKVDNIGNSIVTNVQTIYYLGPGSKNTIIETMPDGVIGMEIPAGSKELVFKLERGGDMAYFSDVPIGGSFSEAAWSPGQKSITLESRGSYVEIAIS